MVMVIGLLLAASLAAMEAYLISDLLVTSCKMNLGRFVAPKDDFLQAVTFYSFSYDFLSFIILLTCYLDYYLKKAY